MVNNVIVPNVMVPNGMVPHVMVPNVMVPNHYNFRVHFYIKNSDIPEIVAS